MIPAKRTTAALAALTLVSILVVGAGCGASGSQSSSNPDPPRVRRIQWTVPSGPIPNVSQQVVGRGSRGAVILSPADRRPTRRTVIFFHSWQPTPPSAEGRWLGHLVGEGNTVIYPAYQSLSSAPKHFLSDAEAGIRSSLRVLRQEPRDVIAIGRTTGGALAFDYAAEAVALGLPVPDAVLAVFPGRRPPSGDIPSADLSRIPASTMLEVIAGSGDPLPGGAHEAQALLAGATSVPRTRRRLLTPTFPIDLPQVPIRRARAAERRAFWAPADRLVTRAGSE